MPVLLQDNFGHFSIGPFPFDPNHSAMGEYHYYPPEGYMGGWYDPIDYPRYIGPSWIITELEGQKYMEQMRVMPDWKHFWPVLVTGDAMWENYRYEATIRPLSSRSHSGIVFRYVHGRRFYFLGFENQQLKLIKRDQDHVIELKSVEFAYNSDTYYDLQIECNGDSIQGYVNGEQLLQIRDDSYPAGKVGLCSRMPAQFTNVRVSMNDDHYEQYLTKKNEKEQIRTERSQKYPKLKLWKKIDLKNFGTSRQVRFGHLTGTDEIFVVLAQHQKRVQKDAYAQISCLTAINLDGDVLWQVGEPSPLKDHAYLTADLPFQICDIDGDGVDEVIYAKDFKLIVLDGQTGKEKNSIPTPLSTDPDESLNSVPFETYAFDRVNVDSIRIANFSGNKTPSDIIIKDRYSRLWVYNNKLELMWKFHKDNTGHFPYTKDVDQDGKEEMFVGYQMVDHDGKLLWTLPVETDHTDEILIGRWHPDKEEELIGIVSGDEGFIVADLQGNIFTKQPVGHAQRISAGNYLPERDGLEICVSTYWGCQGIIYLFDGRGNLLHQFESGSNGNTITPVNWAGDGSDLILLNGNVKHGGLMDGDGHVVVNFPDDGHPDLCAEVLDLTGDARDEIVLWDTEKMYIYTQDRESENTVVKPDKYPLFNFSNYRGEFHYR